MVELLTSWIDALPLEPTVALVLSVTLRAAAILTTATVAHLVARRILLRVVERIARATRGSWDDTFVDRKVFHWLAHLVPAIVIQLLAPVLLADLPTVIQVVDTAALLYMAVVVLIAINAALNAVLEIYETTPLAHRVPIKPVVQVVKALFFFAGAITVVATLIGKSPAVLLSGLGAFTAVLLLVFRDPILGLAAGVQLISNDMVARGDWITVPKFGADGDVVDVSLTTVSVQNWDKTISTIPTYALLTDTFRNWRGMSQSGGRRIKRSINIDMNTVHFLDEELLDGMRRVQFLRTYLDEKLEEIRAWNAERQVDESSPVNGRRLTNLGTFRAYLEHYLREHPMVHDEMTFLVRQLQPTPEGLPIEIYVFSRDQRWAHYEAIQADIFDHVIAVIPLFGLSVFQQPSGHDLRALTSGSARADREASPETGPRAD